MGGSAPHWHLISYADSDCYRRAAQAMADQARGAFARRTVLGPGYMDPGFRRRNREILAQRRGGGLWCWKPYAVFRYALEEAREGDVIVYVDALYRFQDGGAERLAQWVRGALSDDDVALVRMKPEPNRWEYREREWAKRDAYVLLGVDDRDDLKDATQAWAGFLAMRRSVRSMALLAEWMTYAQDIRAVGDGRSVLGREDAAMREHRHDQTLLSLLAKRRGEALREFPRGCMVDLRHAGEGGC